MDIIIINTDISTISILYLHLYHIKIREKRPGYNPLQKHLLTLVLPFFALPAVTEVLTELTLLQLCL